MHFTSRAKVRIYQLRRSSSKIGLTRLILSHYLTYVDVAAGKTRWQDHLVISAVPVGAGIFSFLSDIRLEAVESVEFATVTGLGLAFLFGEMLRYFVAVDGLG